MNSNKQLDLPQLASKLGEQSILKYKGIILTMMLAIVAGTAAKLPFLSIMGIMIISILLGILWKTTMGIPIGAEEGIIFSSKILLRWGIVLMGLRLNLFQIYNVGIPLLTIDLTVIIFTLTVMIWLGAKFSVDKPLSILIAVGTAVCGAAAIVAVAPLIKTKQEHIVLAIACISILGTIGAIGYILLYPLLNIGAENYGVLVGASLHELAHVIAAAVPGGDTSSDMAILIKLGRVLFLVPVALVIAFLFNKKGDKKGNVSFPVFILGFLFMSTLNTFKLIPATLTPQLISLSTYLMAMAMAGLGVMINLSEFKNVGVKPTLVAIIGFILLIAINPIIMLIYKALG